MEEVDYLCSLNGPQVLVTKLEIKSVRLNKERAKPDKSFSFWETVVFASPLHLLSISFALKRVN